MYEDEQNKRCFHVWPQQWPILCFARCSHHTQAFMSDCAFSKIMCATCFHEAVTHYCAPVQNLMPTCCITWEFLLPNVV